MLRAEVFVNIPVKRIAHAYSYRVPEAFSFVRAGWRVVVPFGGRRVEGFVVQITRMEDDDARLKDIIETVDDEAWFTSQMIEAARSLAAFYLCPAAEIMRLFMPGKSGIKIEVRYDINDSEPAPQFFHVGSYRNIWEIIQNRGPLRFQDIQQETEDSISNLLDVLEVMIRHRWLKKAYLTKKKAVEMYREELLLLEPLTDEARERYRRRPAQLRLLEFLSICSFRRLSQGLASNPFRRLFRGLLPIFSL